MKTAALLLLLLVPVAVGAEMLSDADKVSLIACQINLAMKASDTKTALDFSQRYSNWVNYRFLQPSSTELVKMEGDRAAIRVMYGRQSMDFIVHLVNDSDTLFVSARPIATRPEVILAFEPPAGDKRFNTAGAIKALRGVSTDQRMRIGRTASRYGFSAWLKRGNIIIAPKHFRCGMKDAAFRQALMETLNQIEDQVYETVGAQNSFYLRDTVATLDLTGNSDRLATLHSYWAAVDAIIAHLTLQKLANYCNS